MIKYYLTFLAFLAIVAQSKAQSDQAAVTSAFETYKTSVQNSKGDITAKVADSHTMAYFTKMIGIIKNADSVSVDSLPILDKYMVLLVRTKATKLEIMGMDGKALMVYAVNKGIITPGSVANNALGAITITNNAAKAELLMNKKKTKYFLEFNKEHGQWKMDVSSLFRAAGMLIKEVQEDNGFTDNEFVESMMDGTGNSAGPNAWKKVNR